MQRVAARHFATVAGQVHPAPQPVQSRTPSRIRGGAPALGEHRAALLAELGYTWEDVISLQQQGVTRTP
jgi:crotonobetainyl-CoA:carnitine CoA-transferase CaiB-like acyl-CoA transferase